MVKGKILTYGDDLTVANDIKEKVFIEELGYKNEFLEDELNEFAEHVIVEDSENKYVATGRISFDGKNYYISHIAVLDGYRNKFYGDFVVKMLINKAVTIEIDELYLYSPVELIDFFKKYKFETLDDKNVYNHVKMVLNIKNVTSCCCCGK